MKGRIAIIEDNPDNLDLINYLLTHHNYTTMLATDGEQGIRLVSQDPPDLIICDIQLPKMDGYQIAKILKADEVLKKIPLIAVTAFSLGEDKKRILSVGFDGYISKPIDPETFVTEVAKFIKK